MITGFIYYNPNVMGKAWMKASGMTDEKVKSGNMGIIFGASLLLSFLLAFILNMLVTHQTDLFSIFAGTEGYQVEGSSATLAIQNMLETGGDNYRTFKHGAFHGVLISLFLVFPILATNGLFERKPFKLTLINTLYWLITIALMGGFLCQFGFYDFTAL
jgi:hypothetical protein